MPRFLALLALVLLLTGLSRARWGAYGHVIAAHAAVDALPGEMPAFFRAARNQLAYLNPEPDRWRGGAERGHDRALDGAGTPEHFIDLEFIPEERRAGALAALDRFDFADSLRAMDLRIQRVGVLPFTMLEYAQRLRVGFRGWRLATNEEDRLAIEARIINDAGILGHYVTDAANPNHTTIHFNGWRGPNPNGYATDSRFHSRFEGAFVRARITREDVAARVPAAPREFDNLRTAILGHIFESNGLVEALYAQDKATPFGPENDDPAAKAFAADRLGAGARMLRDIWWTAWLTSVATPE